MRVWLRRPFCLGGDPILEGWRGGLLDIGRSDDGRWRWVKVAFIGIGWKTT